MSGPKNHVVSVPVLTDSISGSGEVRASERVQLDSEMLAEATEAYFEVSYDGSALGSDGSAVLVDPSGPTDVDDVTITAGSTSERDRSGSNIVDSLPSGGEVKAEVNGDGTNSATLRSARLVLKYDLS